MPIDFQGTYQLKNNIRILTTTSIFDGHDAAINIMRRIMQQGGAEIIHLGHNRTAKEIVRAAVQEDVQAVAISSYQGGHMEFFKYVYDLLQDKNPRIKIIGGGGGTILPEEVEELHTYGIAKIFTPQDGQKLGLKGMIYEALKICDFSVSTDVPSFTTVFNETLLAKAISKVEAGTKFLGAFEANEISIPIVGITGTGGAGKSSLLDELIHRMQQHNNDIKIGVVSVDPTRKKSGGALLGDRIRMNALTENVFMRSVATRKNNRSLNTTLSEMLLLYQKAEFDVIFLESSGIGQSDTEIVDYCDIAMYIMTSEYGAASQLEKIDMLDFADVIVLNKADQRGSDDAYRDVCKQYKRNHECWDKQDKELPVYKTTASKINDSGCDNLYNYLTEVLKEKFGVSFIPINGVSNNLNTSILPNNRLRYLSEIVDAHIEYNLKVGEQEQLIRKFYNLSSLLAVEDEEFLFEILREKSEEVVKKIDPIYINTINKWNTVKQDYKKDVYTYLVRGKEHHQDLYFQSLSGNKIPKIAVPDYSDWGDIIRWVCKENFPGKFPFTAGVFPLKRTNEDPTRMFAGEGTPERTNRRFHFVSHGHKAKRLSTAFDSITLYGENPSQRPDIYGKIGNSGVSIATLDDAKRLYSGFDLGDPGTSVSMTINGPAPMLLSFFLNAAIDQQCEKYIMQHNLIGYVKKLKKRKCKEANVPVPIYHDELPIDHNLLGTLLLGITGDEVLEPEVYEGIKNETLKKVRGTVQADILKEDQAQNTCIFSTEFALLLMGDIQEYFIEKSITNFYSISVSGYHIAEVGANPISQLAFTLSNGFTYVEYYLSRGMHIDDFAPNLSFFFSNGTDPEYAVIGRVARRIWAKAIKNKYGGNERSQKLKYHIQTSGRSLHASEISFNDIRTTLQALYAIYDNCNSLHTNAYDEAITTPTEESVRRALAIQLIINNELGQAKNENPLQGSFIIHELTDLVEEAVMQEFERISERGGVLAAMERGYQRSKIQEESMVYEAQKLSGELPIIGVNTFIDTSNAQNQVVTPVSRSTTEGKERCINNVNDFEKLNFNVAQKSLKELKTAIQNGVNSFEKLLEVGKRCSLGQITTSLYELGGKYRRNM